MKSEQDPKAAIDVEAVVRDHQAPLLRYAGRILKDSESAQDIVQEAFERLLRRRESMNGSPRRLSNWLFRVTHNLCVDLIRKETRMRQNVQEIEPPSAAPPPSEALAAKEDRERLDTLLQRLTENQRTAIALKFQEKKSYREISEITGLTVSNVGFLIHRGLKKLAEFAREEEAI